MSVQTSIASCASEALIVSERDVLICSRVLVPLCQPVVHNVHIVLSFANANQIVIGLDISMKKAS